MSLSDAPAPGAPATPPPTANTGALSAMGAMFQDTDDNRVVPRKQIYSWALWDWATQPFNSVLLTFVFASLYLVSDNFLPADVAGLANDDPLKQSAMATLTSGYGLATFIAGILILILAPVLGQQADRRGNKKRGLMLFTALLALAQFALFFVHADPSYFWFGAIVLSLGAVVAEIAGVNYNSMLVQISTPRTVGRVSGLGWGMGYIGGIVALTLVVVLTTFNWFGMDTSDGMAYRLIAVGCGVWTIVFSIPIFLNVPEAPARMGAARVGFFRSYVVLVQDITRLYKNHRPTFWFLVSSAVYRDGLAGVFAFGGILAAVVFGFTPTEVMIFGIAANVVAGISTILAGRADDRFGARSVIVTALTGLVTIALLLFFFRDVGTIVFWVGGLLLSAFVGPAQAASRSLLARVTPTGMQGEIFGLYATTGRVARFIAPGPFPLFSSLVRATYWVIFGITIVLAVGLFLLLLVKLPPHRR